jgi:hypothetical protein
MMSEFALKGRKKAPVCPYTCAFINEVIRIDLDAERCIRVEFG